jgi:hypothetical protein
MLPIFKWRDYQRELIIKDEKEGIIEVLLLLFEKEKLL